MMKRAAFVFAVCGLGSILGAANIAAADDSKPASESARTALPLTCLHDTGTRIKLRPNECSLSAGRSYSKTDIDRTGKVTAGGALRLLDPSVTIR
jgi:hypothetical protein